MLALELQDEENKRHEVRRANANIQDNTTPVLSSWYIASGIIIRKQPIRAIYKYFIVIFE
jgi:hypothetical protein